MKKAFPLALIVLGLVFLGAAGFTATKGFDAKDTVRNELIAQNITTPEDASIPNARVDDPKTAQAMADIIQVHALKATGGKTYAELSREDPARQTAANASYRRTGLYTSVMAWNVADLVIGLAAMIAVLGLAVGGVGVALAGLAFPAFARKVHVEPVASA